MGLDMYLRAERYIEGYNYKHEGDAFIKVANPEYESLRSLLPGGADDFAEFPSMRVTMNIGYWRKVNQVHGWFVNNCTRNGEDDCAPIYIQDSKLRELRAIIGHLVDLKALNPKEEFLTAQIEEHLPLADGFFFGSREIDEWYWQGLEMTVPILDKAIDLSENHNLSIYYEASW